MSAKWIRSKQWDDEHLTGALTPLKWALRAISSIPLAVVLLTLVAVYGALASIPIGLVALAPTYAIYGFILLTMLVLIAGLPAWLVSRAMSPASRSLRFPIVLATLLLLAGVAIYAWSAAVWPALRYDANARTGFRLFAEFCEAYKSLPMRRLPGMEMSELEFYAWWPLPTILGIFVLNMVMATLRRIEFRFENLGVLTVHTGIVTLAVGSVLYTAGKREGDVLLLAGQPDSVTGKMTPGPSTGEFYDNTRVVLEVSQGRGWESRLINGLPRYHDYNLGVVNNVLGVPAPTGDQGRTLGIDVPPSSRVGAQAAAIDADLRFMVVGYAGYAELAQGWQVMQSGRIAGAAVSAEGGGGTAVRELEVVDPEGKRLMESLVFAPGIPSEQVASLGSGGFAIQYSVGMNPQRWRELTTVLPPESLWGLIVQTPGGTERVFGIKQGQTLAIPSEGGQPAYELNIDLLSPTPTLPIVTPGYEGATSSVALVRVTPKGGGALTATPGSAVAATSAANVPFTRYVYSRFPELNQDLSDERNERGMPKRTPASDRIRIVLVDASITNLHFDEQSTGAAPDSGPTIRTVLRPRGQAPIITASLEPGKAVGFGQMIAFRPKRETLLARRVEVPIPTPDKERQSEAIGRHKRAVVAVQVSKVNASTEVAEWTSTMWVPFEDYFTGNPATSREVKLPDGRSVRVAFARLRHPLPGMFIRLVDFTMTPYPHSTQPRDFASTLDIVRGPGASEAARELMTIGSDATLKRLASEGKLRFESARTSLNEPLLVGPYYWGAYDNFAINLFGWIENQIGSSRYKFSQSGWDPPTWNQSVEAVKRGEAKAPYVRFTILGVGNNPGYHIIFAGGILIFLGIPWAFYVKPWILRRRRDKLAAEYQAKQHQATSNGAVADQAKAPVTTKP